MKKEYVGKITLKVLDDLITGKKLTGTDAVYLNTRDFDNIVLEYREQYSASLQKPFKIYETLIDEDYELTVYKGQIGIKNDVLPVYRDNNYNDTFEDKLVYRCGWCGNIVDADGQGMDYSEVAKKHRMLQDRTYERIYDVNGYCCRNIEH